MLELAHRHAVFSRRVQVLAELLANKIPPGSSVLDIGCGDGTIANLIMNTGASATIQGLEFAPRENCKIDCRPFDGKTIPFPDASFDVCMFVDVLHHVANPEGIVQLLTEAHRVSRHLVLIKDHLSNSTFDFRTLQFMDWVGNRPHGVVLPYNYQSRDQWDEHLSEADLVVKDWGTDVPIYPFPFSALFGRQLHFVGLLQKGQS